jgi:acyl-CoA synthetase (NDP forming)
MAQNLYPLLNPASVAIVGISQPDRFGGMLYQNLKAFGYPGAIYGVNPRYHTLYDQPCYPSLKALPERPDCALLAVPNHRLLEAMQETADCRIPAAVIFGSAFGEGQNGQRLEAELAALARQNNIAVCGPNCMGLIAFPGRFPVSGYPALTGSPAGHVCLISHSGSIWESMIQNNRDVTYNYAISAGNEMVTTVADYMDFALDDPTTRVIGLFLETVRDPDGFRRALSKAAEQDIPVVALKVGRSERGAKLAQAHSGAMAGTDAVYEALFAHYGVCRVSSPDEMMDTLELFAAGYRPPTRYLSAVLDSGGERALLVDTAEAVGVQFAPLSETTVTALTAVLEPGLVPENPLDAWGTGNDSGQIYEASSLALDADPQTGLTLFAVDMMRGSIMPPTYPDIVLPIRQRFTKPLAFLVNVTAAAGEDQLAQLRQAGIPVLMGTETGLRAVKHGLKYAEFQRCRAVGQDAISFPSQRFPLSEKVKPFPPGPLGEHASKRLLAAYGIPTTAEHIVASLNETLQAAEQLGYPVVLKTAVPNLLHKSDVQGIHLNLTGPAPLTAAYQDLSGRLGQQVLVQEMVSGGLELILGVVNDAQFGRLLVIGLGGIFVELLEDRKLLLFPVTEPAIRQALSTLKNASLLTGLRGRPAIDLEPIIETALKLAQMAADFGDRLAEIDINPLIAFPDRVVAVDALIVFT